MSAELEPLEDDVLSLLRAAKPIADLAPTSKAAILATVEARVALPPTPGGGGDAGGDGGAGGGAGTTGAGAGGGAAAAGAGIGARALAALALTFVVGVATGVVVAPSVTGSSPPSTQLVAVERPRASAAASASLTGEPPSVSVGSLPAASATATVPGVVLAPRSSRSEPAEGPAPSARGLGAERSLLDVARAALARGDAAEALAAVDRHTHDYPDGVLVEEREALAVKALVALGRRDEARARAQRFEQRFPNGLMLRAVKGAVGDP